MYVHFPFPSFLFQYKLSTNRSWNILRGFIFTIDHQLPSNLSLNKLAFSVLDSIYLINKNTKRHSQRKKMNHFIVVIVLFCVIFQDPVFLYSPGCPRIFCVDQVGLEIGDLPASAFQVLEWEACAMTSGLRKKLI